ncbi:cytochrome c oxidase accessory protein CcoG [Urechidicola croceus]|uniref:Cytochrome c oxidase accessory protein CcoG n=1 Tax=Urechidicola croceus TaxID=1850246 RepID=A0A1D8PBT5_9FLAO|nr:cytochrome c oxidase accessory protein CcoG [Urechidicola croceus]AOW22053.1 cytochrome c oxidase accessory protein CcoG [Urechidicola croceus]
MAKKEQESFRDSIGTIKADGKRQWIYPKKPHGFFYKYRTYLSWVLLLFLLVAPFIKINGNQFILLNVLERRFNIFGVPFWPQDFHLVVISMIIGVIFITLFTVIYGRLFCGWVCPQTIFLEMVFRKIEYAIEGDRGAQIRLDKQPWNGNKILKKGLKWIVFFLISFIIANVFLAYFIGSNQLIEIITDNPKNHISGLFSILIFTGIFFFVFTWFREQVCIIVCPYGRLQGVLLDNKSVNVAYDYVRGEGETGRAKFKKNENRTETGKGDCIDCHQCVNVCPTGIDIRNGTQLECVNCTACIDECDHIMESVDLPKGLIRYASEDNIAKGEPFKFTTRVKGYTAVLFVLIGVLTAMLFMRNDIEATVLRLPGQLYETKENNIISNVFTYKLLNKTTEDITDISFKLMSHEGTINLIGSQGFTLKKQELSDGTMFIEIPKNKLKDAKEKIKIGLYSNGKLIETTKTNFLGPRSYR